MKMNIDGAIRHAKESGLKINKTQLALEIWPDSKIKSAKTNFSNLIHGRSSMVKIDTIKYLSKRLGVSADYLFGLTDEPTIEGEIASALRSAPQTAVAEKLKGLMPELGEIINSI